MQIVTRGAAWAIKKYGDDVVNIALRSSAHKAAKNIKKSLLDDEGVVLSKFTTRLSGQERKDPKSKWTISRDVGKDNARGGSYWKLMDSKGKRIATLDKDGKVLRE